MTEAADQGEQGRVGRGFIPVIENAAEQRLALDDADGGAEDDRNWALGEIIAAQRHAGPRNLALSPVPRSLPPQIAESVKIVSRRQPSP